MFKQIINKLKKPNHTRKRFINACLNFVSKFLKTPHVLGLPEQIIIESTNMCNLKCPLCPTGFSGIKRKEGFLAIQNFRKIIDEIGEYIYYLGLTSYGEPFLNKDILKMISYAKSKGILVLIYTNAQLIDRSCAAGIVDSGLDGILISMDGARQASYEKYKKGGELHKVIDAIRFIQEAKEDRGSKYPSITIQCVVMKQNESELEDIRGLARSLKADKLVFKKVCDLRHFPHSFEEIEDYIPDNPDYRAYRKECGLVKWNTDKSDRNFCDMAWNYPTINWDGTLYPCCFDYNSFNLGNVVVSGFRSLWNSRDFVSLRRRILKSKKSIAGCANCPVNFYDGEITTSIPIK